MLSQIGTNGSALYLLKIDKIESVHFDQLTVDIDCLGQVVLDFIAYRIAEDLDHFKCRIESLDYVLLYIVCYCFQQLTLLLVMLQSMMHTDIFECQKLTTLLVEVYFRSLDD